MDPVLLANRTDSARDGLRGGLVFAVLAMTAVVYAGWGLWREMHFANHAVRADARVVLVQQSKDDDTHITVYWPTFSFRDSREHEWIVASRTSVPHYPLDQMPIDIAYDPDDPAGARLASDPGPWMWPSVVGIAGIVFTVCSLTATYRRRNELLDLRGVAAAPSSHPPDR